MADLTLKDALPAPDYKDIIEEVKALTKVLESLEPPEDSITRRKRAVVAIAAKVGPWERLATAVEKLVRRWIGLGKRIENG